jgi:hypothetical protein
MPTGTNAAGLLAANYSSVYASTFGRFEIGIPGTAGYSIAFTNVTALLDYLPALGTPGPLTSDLLNPLTTPSGALGGEVAALKLNIDFSDAGLLTGASGLKFGDLTMCGFTGLPNLNGLAVRQFSAVVNTLLGGGSAAYSASELDPVAQSLNGAFFGGFPQAFAQQHLVNGTCPAGP